MNRLPPALLLAGLLSMALSSPVFAGVCDDVTWGQATGPVALGLLEGGLLEFTKGFQRDALLGEQVRVQRLLGIHKPAAVEPGQVADLLRLAIKTVEHLRRRVGQIA